MIQFAQASQILFQPLKNGSTYVDPTFPEPQDSHAMLEFTLDRALDVIEPKWSPYGDHWDVLWIGHCGASDPNPFWNPALPRGRVNIRNDPSDPAASLWCPEELRQYTDYSRLVHHSSENVCSTAYAVTNSAARQLLYLLGLEEIIGPFDIGLRSYCDGHDGHRVHNCLTIRPQVIGIHRPRGNQSRWSDIDSVPGEIVKQSKTENIRLSSRINLERLIDGRTDYIEQFPD